MSKQELKINQRRFKKNLRRARQILENKLPKKTLEKAKRLTPIDGGNARRNTKLDKKVGRSFEIVADYDYAKVIDRGLYGKPRGSANGPKTRNGYSTQATKGIFDPLEKYVKGLVRRYFRRF